MKTLNLDIAKFVAPHFVDFWQAELKYTYIIGKGGRNSAKSSHAALKMVWRRMISKTSGLCMRKVKETIRDSQFVDIAWAIDLLGVSHLWEKKLSPLKWIFRPTGTEIIFRGGDQAEKLKGLKNKYPIADCWFDEVAEFKTEEELETIINSVLRAELVGEKYTFYLTYNPPKRKGNWLNKKFNSSRLPKDVFVHHSTLFNNPYATSQMIVAAYQMKETNNAKYRWMYLGEAIGGGIVPFDNLTIRRVTDEELAVFDNIRHGIDWGYAVDPFAFLRSHYDRTRKKIIFIDEYYKVKANDETIVKWLKNRNYLERIIADSAEPKSIDRYKDWGIDIIGAKKGPGSVETGEKWLNDDITEIIIDPDRTPNALKEFETIDYKVDKNGEQIARLEDSNNHLIDACRYSYENDVRESAGVW